jgi:hypothetical protein
MSDNSGIENLVLKPIPIPQAGTWCEQFEPGLARAMRFLRQRASRLEPGIS